MPPGAWPGGSAFRQRRRQILIHSRATRRPTALALLVVKGARFGPRNAVRAAGIKALKPGIASAELVAVMEELHRSAGC